MVDVEAALRLVDDEKHVKDGTVDVKSLLKQYPFLAPARSTAPGAGGVQGTPAGDPTSSLSAAMAGVSYAVTPNLKLELGYRYLNMGDATSGFINCVNSNGCVVEKHKYSLESQDIRLGMRWLIGDATPAPAPVYYQPEAPIVRKY